MKTNIGIADRIIRLIIAATVIALCLADVIQGVAGMFSIILAALLASTSVLKFCPLYFMFGLRTNNTKVIS